MGSSDIPSEETMEFAGNLFGKLIGTKGARIKELRQQFSADIKVDKDDKNDRTIVVVCGSQEEIEEAKKEIQKVMSEDDARKDSGVDTEVQNEADTREVLKKIAVRVGVAVPSRAPHLDLK